MHENTRITPENWQAVAHLLPQGDVFEPVESG